MRNAITALVAVTLFWAAGSVSTPTTPKATPVDADPMATVEVEAFGASGTALDAPIIESFISLETKKNFARTFRRGTADNIPFGEYQMKSYHLGFYSETRLVAVYQKHVTVVAGLEVGHEATGPISLHGRVVGLPPSDIKTTFVKLAGVYSSASLESAIDSDGGFKMSGLRWGKSLLLVVGEDGILASRILTYQDVESAQPVVIDIGSKITDH
jgi:hypothetical protein